jgi:predicted acetyltransferase
MCSIHIYTRSTLPESLEKIMLYQFKTTCRNSVKSSHASNIIKEVDLFVVSTEIKKLRGEGTRTQICGFAWVEITTNHYYIEIVCSRQGLRGIGTSLMVTVEELARNAGKGMLQLVALPDAEGFYTKLGFKYTKNACDENQPEVKIRDAADDGFYMSKCLHVPAHHKPTMQKKRTRTVSRPKTKNTSHKTRDTKRKLRSSVSRRRTTRIKR